MADQRTVHDDELWQARQRLEYLGEEASTRGRQQIYRSDDSQRGQGGSRITFGANVTVTARAIGTILRVNGTRTVCSTRVRHAWS